MNEVLSGIIPLQGAQRTPFEDDPDWLWTLNVVDSGTPNLLLLELTVEHSGTGGDLAASFQLTRMVRDPQIYTDAATATTGGTP